jgi:hypothetical protein
VGFQVLLIFIEALLEHFLVIFYKFSEHAYWSVKMPDLFNLFQLLEVDFGLFRLEMVLKCQLRDTKIVYPLFVWVTDDNFHLVARNGLFTG